MKTITDPAAIASLREKVAVVQSLRRRVVHDVNVIDGQMAMVKAPEHSYNLAFLLACEALEDGLEYLRDEGAFVCKTSKLGHSKISDLLAAANGKNLFANYALIEECVGKRHRLAHHGELLLNAECDRYITEIVEQIGAWGVDVYGAYP